MSGPVAHVGTAEQAQDTANTAAEDLGLPAHPARTQQGPY